MSDYVDDINQKLDVWPQEKHEKAAISKMDKRGHCIMRFIQVDREGQTWTMITFWRKGLTLCGLVRKIGSREKKHITMKLYFVAAFGEVYRAFKESHAAVGHVGEKKNIWRSKKYVVEYYSGMFQKEQYAS